MTAEEVIRNYFEALDAEDWERARTLWDEDGEMYAVGARPRRGVDAIVELYPKLFAPWKTHEDRPTRVLMAGNTATVEVRFTGTTHGGRQVQFDAVDVFDLENGRIRKLTNWYDIAYARKALLGPEAEPPAGDLDSPRRIVTALDESGRSYIARAEPIPATTSKPELENLSLAYPDGRGHVSRTVWGAKQLPFELPIDPSVTPEVSLPEPLGVRVSMITYPPGWSGAFFWTDTTDVVWVLSGELVLATDDGNEVVVRRGDCVIQTGINKAWRNAGEQPATIGVVMCGSARVGATPPPERRLGPHRSVQAAE